MEALAGTWWIRDAPDGTVGGYLLQESDGWLLKLSGALAVVEGRDSDEVLHGRCGDTAVSLLNCSRLAWHRTEGGASDETWLVRTAVLGATVLSWDEPAFDLADVELDDLAEFMDLRLVERLGPSRSNDHGDDRLVIGIRREPPTVVRVEGATYELFAGGTTTTGARDFRHVQRASLRVKLDEPASMSNMHHAHIRPLALLLSLAAGRDVAVRDLRLGQTGSNDWMGQSCLWQVLDPRYKRPRDRRSIVALNMMLSCSDWDFRAGYPSWLSIVARYGPTTDLLASRTAPSDSYLSTLFLNTVTAAESFHRRWTPSGGSPSSEHEARVQTLLAAVPTEDRAWLRDRLAWSHEPSLKQRLVDLVEHAGPAALPNVGTPGRWARKVTDARNALVHRPLNRADPETDPHALLALEKSVAAVVTACLLRELGFDAQGTQERMARGGRWTGLPQEMRRRHANLYKEGAPGTSS